MLGMGWRLGVLGGEDRDERGGWFWGEGLKNLIDEGCWMTKRWDDRSVLPEFVFRVTDNIFNIHKNEELS